jgi:hypothetical protein
LLKKWTGYSVPSSKLLTSPASVGVDRAACPLFLSQALYLARGFATRVLGADWEWTPTFDLLTEQVLHLREDEQSRGS